LIADSRLNNGHEERNLDRNSWILLVGTDLIFETKIRDAAQAAEQSIKVISSTTAAQAIIDDQVLLAVVDLNCVKANVSVELAELRRSLPSSVRLIVFGSHVDVDALRAAREAGADLVLPRSEFVRKLNELLDPGKANRSETSRS
jgi:DNA-binding NarL/FixJ family response regulator